LLAHEIASRPHSSAHYTIEASETSQYENHLRAILSLPLGSTELKVPSATTLNLRGTPESTDEVRSLVRRALETKGATVHLYGKKESPNKADSPKGRKIGHVTVVGPSDAEVNDRIRQIVGPHNDPSDPLEPKPLKNHPLPLVSLLMGSDSDLPSMRDAASTLERFNIPFETHIVSAHRTPTLMAKFCKEAASRGVRVIIAGAGGAAHLPGMVASEINLPVIGVPVKGPTLDGVDSLHSIVQMPVRLLRERKKDLFDIEMLITLSVTSARRPGGDGRHQQLDQRRPARHPHSFFVRRTVQHCDRRVQGKHGASRA
jgi:phosphoribosylaminoimidazole carboxylase